MLEKGSVSLLGSLKDRRIRRISLGPFYCLLGLRGSLSLQASLASGFFQTFPRSPACRSSATCLFPFCSLYPQCCSPDGHMVHSLDSFGSILKCHLLTKSPGLSLSSPFILPPLLPSFSLIVHLIVWHAWIACFLTVFPYWALNSMKVELAS